ncbi:MAG: transcription termination factor Rho [Desulfatiglandales bacterium]
MAEEGLNQTEELKLPEKPLEKMTAPELREFAKKIPGVEGVHAMKKERLISIIREYFGIQESKGSPKDEIRRLKAKIRELKKAKGEALEQGETKRAKLIRRRISLLKKKTRRLAKR